MQTGENPRRTVRVKVTYKSKTKWSPYAVEAERPPQAAPSWSSQRPRSRPFTGGLKGDTAERGGDTSVSGGQLAWWLEPLKALPFLFPGNPPEAKKHPQTGRRCLPSSQSLR
jgi:hypothetical protein